MRTRSACAVPGPFDYVERHRPGSSRSSEALHGVDLRIRAGATGCAAREAIAVRQRRRRVSARRGGGAAAGHGASRRRDARNRGWGARSSPAGGIVEQRANGPGRRAPSISCRTAGGRSRRRSRARAAIARYGDPAVDVEDIAARARGGDERARGVRPRWRTALGEVVKPWLPSFEATSVSSSAARSRAAWDVHRARAERSLAGEPSSADDHPRGAARRGGFARRGARDRRSASRPEPGSAEARPRGGRSAGRSAAPELTVAEARAARGGGTRRRRDGGRWRARSDLVGPVPIRLLRPRLDGGSLPVCVWLPGGGWVWTPLAAADAGLSARSRAETGCAVAAVRYRLAPEHPFPAALEDVPRRDPLAASPGPASSGSMRVARGSAARAPEPTSRRRRPSSRGRGGSSPAAQMLLYPVARP